MVPEVDNIVSNDAALYKIFSPYNRGRSYYLREFYQIFLNIFHTNTITYVHMTTNGPDE